MNVKKNLKDLQEYKSISVSILNEGVEFKLVGQRKWRTVRKIIHNLPKPNENYSLIIYDECKQMVLPPEVDVLINERMPFV